MFIHLPPSLQATMMLTHRSCLQAVGRFHAYQQIMDAVLKELTVDSVSDVLWSIHSFRFRDRFAVFHANIPVKAVPAAIQEAM